jgi:hypothetical protein
MNIEEKALEISNKYKIPSCHSAFQIKSFILGKECSDIGFLWQCIKEIQVRSENLHVLNIDYEETLDNLVLAKLEKKEIELETESVSDELKEIYKQKKEIKLRKQDRKIHKVERALDALKSQKNDILYETKIFVEEFESGLKQSNFKDYDDFQAQLEFWQAKFEKELALGQCLGQPINPELIKSCLALPKGSPLRESIEFNLQTINKKLLEKSN